MNEITPLEEWLRAARQIIPQCENPVEFGKRITEQDKKLVSLMGPYCSTLLPRLLGTDFAAVVTYHGGGTTTYCWRYF